MCNSEVRPSIYISISSTDHTEMSIYRTPSGKLSLAFGLVKKNGLETKDDCVVPQPSPVASHMQEE